MGKRKKQAGPSARVVQVGEQVRHALSEMVLEGAIKDPRVHAAQIVTITDVAMTPDLRVARVYVSVFPDDEELQVGVLAGLTSAAGATQRDIADRLRLRFTPRLSFFADDSIKNGAHINALLAEIRQDEEQDAADEDDGPEEE